MIPIHFARQLVLQCARQGEVPTCEGRHIVNVGTKTHV